MDDNTIQLLSKFIEMGLLEAVRDFRHSVLMESRFTPGQESERRVISELRSSEQERAMQQIDDLRNKGASSALIETFLAMKSNLYPENISYFYLQEGLDKIRDIVKRIARENKGGRKRG